MKFLLSLISGPDYHLLNANICKGKRQNLERIILDLKKFSNDIISSDQAPISCIFIEIINKRKYTQATLTLTRARSVTKEKLSSSCSQKIASLYQDLNPDRHPLPEKYHVPCH